MTDQALEDFRQDTRAWLAANCPPGARGPGQIPIGSRSIELEPDVRLWLERMIERGWTVPTWPRVERLMSRAAGFSGSVS